MFILINYKHKNMSFFVSDVCLLNLTRFAMKTSVAYNNIIAIIIIIIMANI